MREKIVRLIATIDNFKHHKHSVLFKRILQGAIVHLAEHKHTLYPKYQKYFKTSDVLKNYFKTYNANDIPFKNYASEPLLIQNLKDLLNALYLLQKTFEELESIDILDGDHRIFQWHSVITREQDLANKKKPLWIRWVNHAKNTVWSTKDTIYNSVKESVIDFIKVEFKIIPTAYQASHLLTHLDLSLFSAFIPEYDSLKLVFKQIKQLSGQVQDYTKITPEAVQDWMQPEQLGSVVGEGLYQLKAEEGSFDIGFLTHLSASLPSFFQNVTDYLKNLSPDLAKVESSFTQEQLDSFQELAEKILVVTDRLSNKNSLMLPFNVLHYIRLIQHIVALGRGVVEHFSLANETSKDVVIDKLRKLKHEYLGELFLTLDKTEAELLLQPGTLSQPWMKTMAGFWHQLARYANNIIDLKEKAPDLLNFNDYAFMNRRIAALENNEDVNKAYLAVNTRRLTAFTEFYKCLGGLKGRDNISRKELTQLAKQYLLFQRFVIAKCPKLHATLVEHFFSKQVMKHHKPEVLRQIYRRLPYTVSWPKCQSELLAKKDMLEHAIETANNTPFFHNIIAKNLREYISRTAALPLIPFQRNISPRINEEKDELIHIYIDFYQAQRNQAQLKKAIKQLRQFETKLEALYLMPKFYINDLQVEDKQALKELYASLQPYLLSCIEQSQKESWERFDRKMVQALTGDSQWLPDDKRYLRIYDVITNLSLFKFKLKLEQQKECIDQQLRALLLNRTTKVKDYKEELQYVSPKEVLKRAHYVFKWNFVPEIPAWIKEKRGQLFDWVMNNYSGAITNQLKKQSKTAVPFPEILDPLIRLSQPHQLVMIKQILNALYFIEQSFHHLANLREDSIQSVYVYQLLKAYQGIEQIYQLGLALHSDPYLSEFISQLLVRFNEVKRIINTNTSPYQLPSNKVVHPQQQPVQWSALWYTIQVLRVMPGHIRTHIDNKQVDTKACLDASSSAKTTCLEIEALLKNSGSYLLVFLSLPQISKLSFQLRDECLSLGQLVNNSVVSHLKEIQDGPLTDILIEADHFETAIGLKSGTVSEPIRKILSKFFAEMVFQQQLPSESIFEDLFSKKGQLRRMAHILQRKDNAIKQTKLRIEDKNFLKPALKWLNAYNCPSKQVDLSEKAKLVNWIRKHIKAFKKLEQNQPIPIEILNTPNTNFEKDIYTLDNELEEDLPKFEYRLKRLNARLTGEIASHLFASEKEDRQKNYLSDEDQYLAIINAEHKALLERFIELKFDNIATPYFGRTIGISSLSEEYTNRFQEYKYKERNRIRDYICQNPITDLVEQDLQKLAEDAAKRSIGQFVQANYDDYVLLCEFIKQLELCKSYCSGLSVNENHGPKQVKYNTFLELLNKLIKIAKNEVLSPAERIKELKKETQKPVFYSRLMNIRNEVEPFTWLWFKQCIEDLLAMLHLRKPTRLRHFDNIRASLEVPPVPMRQLYKANGFFSLNLSEQQEQVTAHNNLQQQTRHLPNPSTVG